MQQSGLQMQDREFDFDDIHFRFLAGLANARTGIVLQEGKKDMVYGRLVRRLRALKLETFADYCNLLQSEAGAEELGQMVNAITTNLTHFFREKHHFEHLRGVLADLSSQPRIRIWSAGCSSGMEPYSIAMTLKAAQADARGKDVRILATDIDSNMLNTGMQGEYDASEFKEIPSECRRYVEQIASTGRMRMNNELKRLISFKQLNLIEAWPMQGPFDAIFCRNVVIYFDKPTKQSLFDRMADLLKPDGWLYIGHSENLHGITDRFELQGRTMYRRIK